VVELRFPPVLPSTLFRLETLLSTYAIDLHEASRLVRSDVGLAVNFLSALGRGFNTANKGLWLEEAIVELGAGGLRAVLARTTPLADHPGKAAGMNACHRFWKRARMTALVAEEIASCGRCIQPDEAYFAGMLYRLGELPALLSWNLSFFSGLDSNEIASALMNVWGLPDTLNLWRQNKLLGSTSREFAKAADDWVDRMEHVLGSQLFSGSVERHTLRPKK
jgi:HD-like signal output (HDOD) protein